MKTCEQCGAQFEQVKRGRARRFCFQCRPSKRIPGYVPPCRRTFCIMCGRPAQLGTGSREYVICRHCRNQGLAPKKPRKTCADCESPSYGTRCRPCANRMQRLRPSDDPRVRRADRERSAPGLTRRERDALMHQWRRRGERCAYCPANADTMDHVVPLIRGGTNYEGNLVPCCRYCNGSKAGWFVSEWRHDRKPDFVTNGITWVVTPAGRRTPKVLVWAEPAPFKSCPVCAALHTRPKYCSDGCGYEAMASANRDRYRQSVGIPLDKPTPRQRRAAQSLVFDSSFRGDAA